jgi:hypothetical protein
MFTLSNRFTINVSILANGSIVVCIDIIEYPKESREYRIYVLQRNRALKRGRQPSVGGKRGKNGPKN